jgi:hypothetical protein
MPEPKENPLMEKIVSLCKRRGFIFQSSEIYGGINGFWDYGPMGAELKRNVKESWWLTMTRQREDVVGLEATIIMSPAIWRASGHVDTFADLMRECPLTKKRVRADQVEPQSGMVYSYNLVGEAEPIERYLQSFPSDLRGSKIEFLRSQYAGHQLENTFNVAVKSVPLGSKNPEEHLLHSALKTITLINPISILLPSGKPVESARKKATEYLRNVGFKNPFFFDEHPPVEIKDSLDYHPESGFK